MLEFICLTEPEALHTPNYAPLKTAFVILESAKGYLLLYNKYRKLWELAGGMIEDGETPRACAVRECKEECNQTISNLNFVGLAKLSFKKNEYRKQDAVEYSAVYSAFLQGEEDFLENEEIQSLRWWKPDEEIEGACSASVEMIRWHLGRA